MIEWNFLLYYSIREVREVMRSFSEWFEFGNVL